MLRFYQYCFVALCLLIILGCSNNTIQNKDELPELQIESVTNDSTPPPDQLQEDINNDTPLGEEDNSPVEEDTTLQETPDIQPYNFTYNEQEFEIIPFYKEILEFIALARKGEEKSLEKLYADTISVPLRNSSGWSLNYFLLSPTPNLDKLEGYTHQLIHNTEKVNEIIIDAIKKSSDVLSGKSKKRIYLFPFHPDQNYISNLMSGVGGLAYVNTILIFIDPMNYSEDMLSYIVAHEYHHTMYFEMTYRTNYNFLGSIIIEGQADTFAEMVYPEIKAPWTAALTQNKEKFVWNTMIDQLNKSITMANLKVNFLNGDYNLGIPPWSNYKIGYQIMQDFMKNNPDVSIEEWTKMKATEILELSRFEERFKD